MVAKGALKPHIAFLPSPGMGHIIPLLELAKRLVIHHGFHVSFLIVTTTEPPPSAQSKLLSSTRLPPNIDVVHLPPADLSTLVTDDTPLIRRLFLTIQESFKSLKGVLCQLAINKQPLKAVVIDLLTTDAYEVCKDLFLPVYSFFTTSTAMLAFELYLPDLLEFGPGPESMGQPELFHIPGCKPIRAKDFDDVPDPGSEENLWLMLHCSRLRLLDGIMINSWEDFDPVTFRALRNHPFYKKIQTPPVHPVGPLIREAEPLTDSDTQLVKWLDKQDPKSVLFVSLGSGGILSSEQLNEMAWGLEMSQHRFIWVVRPPNDGGAASSAFFDQGNEEKNPKYYLPEGFLDRTRGVGVVAPSWAPQVTILRHPSTGGFLSHCGWNSILEALVHGVPIIAWPLYSEQKLNSGMLTDEEQIGVAVRPKATEDGGVVNRKEVERVVRLVMEEGHEEQGKMIRKRAKELKESARNVLDIGGSSYQSLSCMAEKWRSGRD